MPKSSALSSLALGLLSLAAAGSAFAQANIPVPPQDIRYGSYLVFGDSLSDNGNLYNATNRTQPPSPPYFNGRFSTGPVFAELVFPGLTQATTAPATARSIDFAFGGAVAQGVVASPPSFTAQLGLFQQRQFAISSSALVSVLFGANDFFNAVPQAANQNSTAITNLANASAASIIGGVNTLIAAGGKNFIVYGLPDLGATPQFAGTAAQPLATIYTDTLNSALRTQYNNLALANPSLTIRFFDLKPFLAKVQGMAAFYGFNGGPTGRYITAANTLAGDPNNFIFTDGVHPTAQVGRLAGFAVLEVLNPEVPLRAGITLTRGALATADLYNWQVITRLDALRSRNFDPAPPAPVYDAKGGPVADGKGKAYVEPRRGFFEMYAGYGFQDGDRDGDFGSSGFRYHVHSGFAGGDFTLANGFTAGLQLNIGETTGRLDGGQGRFRFNTNYVAAYAMWRPAMLRGFFFDGSFGGGTVDVNQWARQTFVPGFVARNGDVSGTILTGHIRGGYEFKLGQNVTFGPTAAFRYLNATNRGFNETDAGGLEFGYNRTSISSYNGTFGLFANATTRLGSMDAVLRLKANYTHDFNDGRRNVRGRLVGGVGYDTVLSTYEGNRDGFDFGVGGTLMLTKRLGVSADYTGNIRNDDKFQNTVSANVHFKF